MAQSTFDVLLQTKSFVDGLIRGISVNMGVGTLVVLRANVA